MPARLLLLWVLWLCALHGCGLEGVLAPRADVTLADQSMSDLATDAQRTDAMDATDAQRTDAMDAMDAMDATDAMVCAVGTFACGSRCLPDATRMCTPGPCRLGQTQCPGDVVTCVDTGPAMAGASCAGGLCSAAGACVACVDGAACDNPAEGCEQGVQRCVGGVATCAMPFVPKLDGTVCATGFCAAGRCAMPTCVVGRACRPMGNACRQGLESCPAGPAGASVCTDTGAESAGVACGGTNVCDGTGSCGAPTCVPGGACSPVGNMCQRGVVSCPMGAGGPVTCTPMGNVAAGTGCGGANICDGMGLCVAPTCVAGGACLPGGNACRMGQDTCPMGPLGPVTCAPMGNVAAGTGCGGTNICDGMGMCIAPTCTVGMPCNPGGNVCALGSTLCPMGPAGAPTCNPTGSEAAGTSCGGMNVCNGTGGCVAPTCMIGMACNPGGNVCVLGSNTCPAGPLGAGVCAMTGNVGAGTPCGGANVCDGAGTCGPVTCTVGAACNPGGNVCALGSTLCPMGPGGPPTCNPTGSAMVGTSCGGTNVCNGSGSCVAPTCMIGMACNPGGNVCVLGSNTCPAGPLGAGVCAMTGNAGTNIACPSMGVAFCDGAGTCVTQCTPGGACSLNNGCRVGTNSCTAGPPSTPVCDQGLSNTACGTACGGANVCDGMGSCGPPPCVGGALCPSPVCQRNTEVCATQCSMPVCTFESNDPAGTSCGAGQACDGAGSCVGCTTCVAGRDCQPDPCLYSPELCPGGPCLGGACGAVTPEPAGTACGGGNVCNGAGGCQAPCVVGNACNPGGNVCVLGLTACPSGPAGPTNCNPAGNAPSCTPCQMTGECVSGACQFTIFC
ncbi:MAG: hypothetical protein Q8Q09_06860 [Deltaproteobacteria bacterium]|nr:hypothetical protein [Deltaproteobacteria bacterium]